MWRVTAVLGALLLASAIAAAQGQTGTIQVAPTPGATPQLPPRDPQQPQTGTAIVRGRVFAFDTAAPLRRAQVRIFGSALREQRMASTDAEGRYEFKDLPAGRYNIGASKGSYVPLQYGQRRPFEPGKPLEIADGQTVEKVDFTLPRGGVVTGRVFDEFGDPVADAQVAAMRYGFMQGRRQLVPAGRFSPTNDIGEFRLFGLPPGDYYISATLRTAGFGGSSDDRSGYTPTYYPGTASVAEAQKITVPVGQTVSNIAIALLVSRTARVSGTVTDTDGKAATAGFVMMFQRSGMMIMGNTGGQIRPDGTFTVSNVAPGDYTLMANIGAGMGDATQQSASITVNVAGDDIDGVRLAALRPAVASGRIVLDGAMPNSSIRPAQFRVNASPAAPEVMMGQAGGGGTANDDFSFQFKVRPCACVVRSFGAPSGWYLKSVRLNGSDVTDTGIEFKADQEVSGLEIVFTNKPAELSGTVTDAKGDASHDYTVVLFARDRERWNPGSRYLSTARPDQDGRFKLRGLPAGDYYAVAVDFVEQGAWTDPEYLDQIKTNATSISIGEGETKTLDLKLVATSQ